MAQNVAHLSFPKWGALPTFVAQQANDDAAQANSILYFLNAKSYIKWKMYYRAVRR